MPPRGSPSTPSPRTSTPASPWRAAPATCTGRRWRAGDGVRWGPGWARPPRPDLGERAGRPVPVRAAGPVCLPARPDPPPAQQGTHRPGDRRAAGTASGTGRRPERARLLRFGQPQRRGHLPAPPGLVRRQPGPPVEAAAGGKGQAVRGFHRWRRRGGGQGPRRVRRTRNSGLRASATWSGAPGWPWKTPSPTLKSSSTHRSRAGAGVWHPVSTLTRPDDDKVARRGRRSTLTR